VKGQLSIEFFLILAIILVFTGMLLTASETQISGMHGLNDVIMSKNVLDGVASMADYVFLSGNGSKVSREFFIPQRLVCFAAGCTSSDRLCCFGIEFPGKKVESSQMFSIPQVNGTCVATGWLRISTQNVNNVIFINCISLG